MKISYNTLEEVKAATIRGVTVYWGNPSYTVKLSKSGDFNVVCANGHCAYLSNDYKAEDFYSL